MVEKAPGVMRFDEANAVQRRMRLLAGTRPMAWLFARVLHRIDRPIMRRSHGRRSFTSGLTGLPIVELTTVGARTGQPRTMPIVGVPDGDRLVLVASNFGQHHHPGWYFNLRADPHCAVAHRGRSHAMVAYEAEGDERERLWQLDVSVYPPRAVYAQRSGGRRIPVMVLRPAAQESTAGGEQE
ncbi:MAG TPA: nitroreductase/quinone reductase family protein [Frankiaceae bacterium]|jgi:deazaflavin-dependent oxidoreductase (nitroreductase family)|nr:nitroreductase/quinone reductase family protein [Frankiaceae bacterium]